MAADSQGPCASHVPVALEHVCLPAVHTVASDVKRWMREALNRAPKDK
jgi:hypothetical protein